MKRITQLTVVLVFLSWAGIANATIMGFTGAYDPSNWDFFTTATPAAGDFDYFPGSVDTSLAPASIRLTGADCGDFNEGDCPGTSTDTTYTIQAVAAGLFMFDWSADTDDSCCGDFRVIIGGAETTLWGAQNGANSGTYSTNVAAGTLIGWNMWSSDTCCGEDWVTISSFKQGGNVPVPATLALFGIGLAGLGWSRRKKV